MHRPQHFVGHRGGPGDRQKFPPGANDHFVVPCGFVWRRDAGEWREIQASLARFTGVASSFETPAEGGLLRMRSSTLMARSAATPRVSNHEATKSPYRLVSRQPAASASSTEQNQRVPLLTCILIWAYQRLVGL